MLPEENGSIFFYEFYVVQFFSHDLEIMSKVGTKTSCLSLEM